MLLVKNKLKKIRKKINNFIGDNIFSSHLYITLFIYMQTNIITHVCKHTKKVLNLNKNCYKSKTRVETWNFFNKNSNFYFAKPNNVFPQKEEEYATKYSILKFIFAKSHTKNNGYY